MSQVGHSPMCTCTDPIVRPRVEPPSSPVPCRAGIHILTGHGFRFRPKPIHAKGDAVPGAHGPACEA